MKDLIMITQMVNILFILIMTWVVFNNMKNRMHYYLFINCAAMLLCSAGSMMMLLTENEEACFMSFMISWAGKVGVVISVFFFIIHLCEYKLPIVVKVTESAFAVITYVIIATTNKTGLFYKDFHLVKEDGMTILEYSEGPWHMLWNITIVAVIVTCLFMLHKAIVKEKNPQNRKKYLVIIAALLVEIVIGFLTVLPIGRYYDFNQLGFLISAFFILFAIFRNNLMDAATMAKEYVIDELSSGVIAMDTTGTVAYYNKKALQIFPEIISDEKSVIAQIEESIKNGEPITVDDRIYNFEERKLYEDISEESKLYVIIDSTKQYQHLREVEREKQIADAANRAKSDFLASMSHEIRTPINAVLGMDEMILRESAENNIREYAQDIKTAGNTLLTIINDILDLNKIEAGKMEIVPVTYELTKLVYDISNMIKLRAKDKNLSYKVEVAPDIPSKLYGDDVRIRQILTNLLTNAVKYTMSGEVCLKINLISKQESSQGKEVTLHFEVKDTGIGIKSEDLDKLFSDFERIEIERNRNIEGTGLGMPITMKLLSMMDSEIQVKSEYGKGSVFSFDLKQIVVDETPIGNYDEKKHNINSDIKSDTESFDASDLHVLVVDDNSINIKVFTLLLQNTQLKITEADSGYKAVELAVSQKFDAIFMDHMMPGMDGVEAMKKIKAVKDGPCANTPIIALTANAVSGSKEQYLQDGFDGYLSKPIEYDNLLKVIRSIMPEVI